MSEQRMKAGAATYSSSVETAANYIRWVLSACAPFIGSSIIEVGFGHGGFLEHLPPEKRCVGLDIDAEVVERARARHGDRALFLRGDIASPDVVGLLAGHRIDTALCVNVLEHIEDDRAAVANLIAILDHGGHALLFVPALPRLYNDLDRLAGHRRRYTASDVRALVPAGSAELVHLEYFNPVGALGWWLNGLVRHRSLESPRVTRQVELFDAWIVPVSRAVSVATRRFVGQSILGVVRKL
jgi:SAM-dependent methyltransferase